MPSREEVLEVLRPVQDPELHRSIVFVLTTSDRDETAD